MITAGRIVVAAVATLKSGSRIVAATVAKQGESAGSRIVTTGGIDIECLSAASHVGIAADIASERQIIHCRIAGAWVGAIGGDGI